MSISLMQSIKSPEALLVKAFDKALKVNEPMVRRHISRIVQSNPNISSAEMLEKLNNEFLTQVALLGVAAGAAAATPGVGTSASIVLSVAEIGTFFEASCLYVMSLCLLNNVWVEDLACRRTLILSILLGNSGEKIVADAAGRTGAHWGKLAVQRIPNEMISNINKVLGRNFVTKFGSKRGVIVLGTVIPFGIGAFLGGTLNLAMGYAIIRSAKRAFGQLPQSDEYDLFLQLVTPKKPGPTQNFLLNGELDKQIEASNPDTSAEMPSVIRDESL